MPSIKSVSASLSTVSVFPATVENDGVERCYVTIAAKYTDGTPVAGAPDSAFVLAVSGTGNTVTQPTGVTNGDGEIVGSFISTVAATKTASFTVASVAITDTASPVVTAGVVSPDLLEDFSTYSSTANMLADPRNIYNETEDSHTDRMVLDTSVGLSPSTQSMRYDYPSGSSTDYTISRSIPMPVGVTTEVWVEATVRFSADFTLNGNGQGAGPAYKLLHVGIASGGPAGRFGINMEGGDASVIRAEGPNDDYSALYIFGSTVNSTLFDGANHTLYYHVQLGATDLHEFWVDGVYQGSATGATGATSLTAVSLSKNLNMLAANAMEVWWMNVKIYDTDPGWV